MLPNQRGFTHFFHHPTRWKRPLSPDNHQPLHLQNSKVPYLRIHHRPLSNWLCTFVPALYCHLIHLVNCQARDEWDIFCVCFVFWVGKCRQPSKMTWIFQLVYLLNIMKFISQNPHTTKLQQTSTTLRTKGRPKGTPSGGHDSTIGIDSAAASGSTSVDLQHCAFPMVARWVQAGPPREATVSGG